MDDHTPAPLRRRGTRHPYRRRARIACVCCHDRKVRCDVAVNGSPCTNCRLDGNKCAVKDRGTKAHDAGLSRNVALAKADSSTIDRKVSSPGDDNDSRQMSIDVVRAGLSYTSPIHDTVKPLEATAMEGALSQSLDPLLSTTALGLDHTKSTFSALSDTFSPPILQPLFDDLQFNISDPFSSTFSSDFSHVPYKYYHFLHLDPISHLPAEDINFLERKRCFHIPCRPIVDDFVAKYFLHIHPGLPHINESEFWHMYFRSGSDRSTKPSSRLSLFVFQCMLFAGCSFVPLSTLQKCGFSSIKDARASFYRRAKLLYDFNTERDPYSIACGALLLTMFVSEQQHQVNTTWLSAAIMNAKAANAHLYSHDPYMLEPERRRMKRLWWGCILQDRIIALGLRRPLQITPEQFDLDQPCLEEEDFQEELMRSRVYEETTKSTMVRILVALCKLAVLLTQAINTVYPQNGFSQFAAKTQDLGEKLPEAETNVQKARKDLQAWFDQTQTTLEDKTYGAKASSENVTLYRNIIFMYYYGAKSALAHHEALLIETYISQPTPLHDTRLKCVAHELQDTSTAISTLFKEIMELKIAQHMPISAVAYIAFPLVLNTLDLQISTNAHLSPKKKQLDYYSEAMRMCAARYEGTGKLAAIVKRLVAFAANESRKLVCQPSANKGSTTTPEDGGEIRDWLGVLVKHPKLYLKVSLSLDLSMAKGRYPDRQDMPETLFLGPISRGELTTSGSEKLLTQSTYLDTTDQVCKPSWTNQSIPRTLGNISMEFSFLPNPKQTYDIKEEGPEFQVNLDFMEINVDDMSAAGDEGDATTTGERERWVDDLVDWPVE